jgi:hypothetical protein
VTGAGTTPAPPASAPDGRSARRPDLRDALTAIAASADARLVDAVAALGAHDRHRLPAAIAAERLSGLALDAHRRGALALDSAARAELEERHASQRQLDAALEHALVAVVAALDAAGIEYRALKGAALAHLLYPSPDLRSYGDVDVLVGSADFDRAVRTLGDLGFRRRFLEPRPGFDARFAKGSCLARGDGLEIDLHRTLGPGPFGARLARTDLLARPPRHFVLHGTRVAAFDPELAFVHACFHAALGDSPPRLVPLRDVLESIRSGFDAESALELVRVTGCEIVVDRAIALLAGELRVTAGEVGAHFGAVAHSRLDRWILRTYDADRRSYAAQAAASFWAVPGVRDRAAFTRALAFPTRDYVRAREGSYLGRFRRGTRLVRDWRPR